MKKNLLTVLILALVIVNLVLNCVIIFTLVPENKKVNNLITQIASAIDLELNTDKDGNSILSVPIDQVATYTLEENMTIALKAGEDGASHFAVLGITISMDTENDDYKDKSAQLTAQEALVKSTIISTVSQFTLEEAQSDPDSMRYAILDNLQSLFESNFIISIDFPYMVFQ